jgi:uncharacterized membrane protein YccC
MLFCCALLMGHEKTAGLGFVAVLYFANAGGFQNRMAYDPVAFLNVSLAIALAMGAASLLFAIVFPDTPEAARRRFVRVARAAFERIASRRHPIASAEFETVIAEALYRLRRSLRPDSREDLAVVEAGIVLLGTGRELIRVQECAWSATAREGIRTEIEHLVAGGASSIERMRRIAAEASAACLSELREDRLGASEARVAAREVVAFAAIRDELERAGGLLLDGGAQEGLVHVA